MSGRHPILVIIQTMALGNDVRGWRDELLPARHRRVLGDRRDPDTPPRRHPSPFPSGHSASAFAFVAGIAAEAPEVAAPLSAAAAVVAYSRVHTGVHYPGDVIVGSLVGAAIAPIAVTALRRRGPARSEREAPPA